MLTKKKLTKFLNDSFRMQVISSFPKNKLIAYKIPQMARYVVDSQIMNRSKTHANDKTFGYGFSPINVICAVLNDGSIDKRFFEFNSINHFLVEKNGDAAVEVVMCILIEWVKENKDIKDFDIDIIDRELARIEAEYVAAQKTKSDKTPDNMISSAVEDNNANG